jgi:hypothetical protein
VEATGSCHARAKARSAAVAFPAPPPADKDEGPLGGLEPGEGLAAPLGKIGGRLVLCRGKGGPPVRLQDRLDHVLGQIDRYRARPARAGDLEGLADGAVEIVIRRTRKLCFVQVLVMPMMSTSWKPSLPIIAVETWPVSNDHRDRVHIGIGDPVTVLVARARGGQTDPHPPGGPGKPSAAWMAPCSCLTRMCRIACR